MPWGFGGLNTHDLLVLILEDSRSSVHPDDFAWVPLVQFVFKGVYPLMYSKSMYCMYLQQTMP